MKTISLISLKGGTGKTALAAHLGAALIQENQRALVVDADPQNALGHWFGMEMGERTGLARIGLDAGELLHYKRRSRSEVPYLPFGSSTDDELMQLERTLFDDPEWLARRLPQITGNEYDIVILDTASGNSLWTRQALAASDIAVAVLLPDSGSYATLPQLEHFISRFGSQYQRFTGTGFLVNQMDGRSDLSRDVKAALYNLIPDSALPFSIPNDESFREAYARRQTLYQRYPDSQAIASIRELAVWVTSNLSQHENTGAFTR